MSTRITAKRLESHLKLWTVVSFWKELTFAADWRQFVPVTDTECRYIFVNKCGLGWYFRVLHLITIPSICTCLNSFTCSYVQWLSFAMIFLLCCHYASCEFRFIQISPIYLAHSSVWDLARMGMHRPLMTTSDASNNSGAPGDTFLFLAVEQD